MWYKLLEVDFSRWQPYPRKFPAIRYIPIVSFSDKTLRVDAADLSKKGLDMFTGKSGPSVLACGWGLDTRLGQP